MSWGLGHTLTLVLLGLVILALGLVIPERLALLFEFIVGIVLVVLGLQVYWSFRRSRVHLHEHQHTRDPHRHFHSHAETPEHAHHGLFSVGKPFFRAKSFVVGVFHGVAGSAALMLLVLTTIQSYWAGVLYLALFGVGTIAAMGIVTLIMGVPFSATGRFPAINRLVQLTAGTASILFGGFVMYQVGIAEGLFRLGG